MAIFAFDSLQCMKICKRLIGIILLIPFILAWSVDGMSYHPGTAPEWNTAFRGRCAAMRPCRDTAGLLAESTVSSAPQTIQLIQHFSGSGNFYGKHNRASEQNGTRCSTIGRNRQTAPLHPVRHMQPVPFGIRWLQVFRI